MTLPSGMMTWVGIAFKLLSALVAVLGALMANDMAGAIQILVGVAFPAYATGDALTSRGIRRAIATEGAKVDTTVQMGLENASQIAATNAATATATASKHK